MASTDKPSASVIYQSQTDTPVTGDSTLVDDTVALVDDPIALVGGPNTATEDIRNKIAPDKPRADLPRFR